MHIKGSVLLASAALLLLFVWKLLVLRLKLQFLYTWLALAFRASFLPIGINRILALNGKSGDVLESLFNVVVVLGRGFIQLHAAVLWTELASVHCADLTFVCKITFVAHDEKREGFWLLRSGLCHEYLLPVKQMFKTCLISYIVHKAATVSSTIKRRTQRLKPLLASCIPDL